MLFIIIEEICTLITRFLIELFPFVVWLCKTLLDPIAIRPAPLPIPWMSTLAPADTTAEVDRSTLDKVLHMLILVHLLFQPMPTIQTTRCNK